MFATRIKCVTIVCSVVINAVAVVVPGDGGDDDAYCVRTQASISFKLVWFVIHVDKYYYIKTLCQQSTC